MTTVGTQGQKLGANQPVPIFDNICKSDQSVAHGTSWSARDRHKKKTPPGCATGVHPTRHHQTFQSSPQPRHEPWCKCPLYTTVGQPPWLRMKASRKTVTACHEWCMYVHVTSCRCSLKVRNTWVPTCFSIQALVLPTWPLSSLLAVFESLAWFSCDM